MITENNSLPVKTTNYRYAEDVFYKQFNDINFYFEDAENENLYFYIFKTLFRNIRFDNIFTLGGKGNVIAQAKKDIGEKSKVFILDKDFDDLRKKILDLDNLFYLKKYSIENYLLEESPIIDLIVATDYKKLKRPGITRKLDLNKLISLFCTDLKDLVVLYYTVQRFNLGIENTKSKIDKKFCKNIADCELDPLKIIAYEKEIRRAFENKYNHLNFDTEKNLSKKQMHYSNDKIFFSHIPGKQILVLLLNKIIFLFPSTCKIELEEFTFRLSQGCKFNSLRFLKTNIKRRINSH